MYAKCGCLPKAREVFAKMNIRNVVTWTAMISGYSEQGEDEEALCCFEHMCSAGIVPDSGTFVCALKGCGGMHNSTKGYELNGEIIFRGLECENIVGNALIDLYVRCGLLIDAQAVFDAHSARDLISWNTLLTGYAEHGPHEQVLRSFERMHAEHISPSGITFVCALKASSNLEAKEECRQIHGEVVALGLFDSDIFLVSMLVDVYSKFGSLAEAYQVLVGSDSRDVVSWNAMIGGYVEHDLNEEALGCLKEMEAEGILADTCTYIYILKACSCIGKIYAGCIIHGEIVKRGLENNLLICHPLMNMYANFGYVETVQNLLDSVSIRNAFVWNSLLMAYTDLGDHRTVLLLVKRMEEEGTSPDFITLACSLGSCAWLGLASEGQVLHSVLVKQGKENEFVAINALANMYLSCGLLIEAQDSFKRLTCKNVVLWTALMAGYSQMGESGIVFSMFNRMRNEGHCPDSVSFLMVLNACGRAGLVDEGESYFISHNAELSIILAVEHFTCIVDLYSRCGNMDKAIVIIGNMPFHPGLAVWNVMLWASQGCENVELAKVAFQEAVQLDDGDIAAYVSMSNIYAKYGGSTGMYHHL
ncbi:hypothetical protein KP509_1Z028600 [Ceratopteris richardii]|nr:hypothetical protein KP509_1Z028600 [Ceratopteris richardii]